jgi:anaerobic dimethyl sulfoxide reductase subunit B (iron-sulfur subunit)
MNHALRLDLDRCVGCMTCAVACMDQNDLEVGGVPTAWREVFIVESGAFPEARIRYVSMACMHCEDAPCGAVCPTKAISRDAATQAVRVDATLCIGCHSCSIVCPFGVPRFGSDGSMQKCDLCSIRVENDLEPACVRACPNKALHHGDPNTLALGAARKAAERLTGKG